jgi:pyruvate dehydrogenase E1 component
LVYGAYSGARFIIVGTPSGISLSPEGGSHQSLIAPSLGIETPNVVYCEPCFGKELEWIFFESVRRILTQRNPFIVYLRLSTKTIHQDLFFRYALHDTDEKTLRKMVIKGGYRLIDHSGNDAYDPSTNVVNIFASGVMLPEAINASNSLKQQDIFANVINVTSPDLLYQGFYLTRNINMKGSDTRAACHMATLIPAQERKVPIITVMDGHPHALSFLGSIFGAELLPLGVCQFGQSGSQKELYNHYDISERAIVQAARHSLQYTIYD